MSELDQSINDVENEIHHQSRTSNTSRHSKPETRRLRYVLLAIIGLIIVVQTSLLSTWIFGVPEVKVQADITTLLESTDEQLQTYQSLYGEAPATLPQDMPGWLIEYKKTLLGYRLNTTIENVSVELDRSGEDVVIRILE